MQRQWTAKSLAAFDASHAVRAPTLRLYHDQLMHRAILSFVNRFLVRHKGDPLPVDSNKLRLSFTAFQSLINQLELTPAFVFALSRYYLPTPHGYRPSLDVQNRPAHDFWCLLPVRIQVSNARGHAQGTVGRNQINPMHYLHLPKAEVDIRGSQIALFTRFNLEQKSGFTLVFNFIDGRWKAIVEQPQKRLKEFSRSGNAGISSIVADPFCIYIIYLTTVQEWWINALRSFDDQLIAHVRPNRLQTMLC